MVRAVGSSAGLSVVVQPCLLLLKLSFQDEEEVDDDELDLRPYLSLCRCCCCCCLPVDFAILDRRDDVVTPVESVAEALLRLECFLRLAIPRHEEEEDDDDDRLFVKMAGMVEKKLSKGCYRF
mmetsp:Transcript_29206/g.48599  ORF Transcript_29206/g.48599 Transcript_29206/m.48599 type:complete len:123 (+) Transcript_29206:281-649(+)